MRVVITGAAGFIGSRLSELFVADAERLGYDDVVLLDALTYSGRLENLEVVLRDSRVSFIRGSITDQLVTDEVLSGAHAVLAPRRRESRRSLHHGCATLLRDERHGHPATTRECARRRGRAIRARLDRRGVRVHRGRFVARGPPPSSRTRPTPRARPARTWPPSPISEPTDSTSW